MNQQLIVCLLAALLALPIACAVRKFAGELPFPKTMTKQRLASFSLRFCQQNQHFKTSKSLSQRLHSPGANKEDLILLNSILDSMKCNQGKRDMQLGTCNAEAEKMSVQNVQCSDAKWKLKIHVEIQRVSRRFIDNANDAEKKIRREIACLGQVGAGRVRNLADRSVHWCNLSCVVVISIYGACRSISCVNFRSCRADSKPWRTPSQLSYCITSCNVTQVHAKQTSHWSYWTHEVLKQFYFTLPSQGKWNSYILMLQGALQVRATY